MGYSPTNQAQLKGIYFEIDLITSDNEYIPVDALFDTGFTSGILGIHVQDEVEDFKSYK